LFAEEFAGAVERSRDLARHCAAVADARSCPWIDAGAHVRSSDDDGVHLDAPNHEQLGVVVAHRSAGCFRDRRMEPWHELTQASAARAGRALWRWIGRASMLATRVIVKVCGSGREAGR
jgi:hypothetical protein